MLELKSYEVRFQIPAEIIVRLEAEDEETAADAAWERANEHTKSVAMDDRGVSVRIDLDGHGADEVLEASR